METCSTGNNSKPKSHVFRNSYGTSSMEFCNIICNRCFAKMGGTSSTFGTIGTALQKLDKLQKSVSQTAQRAAAKAQQNAEAEIKLLDKKIQLIEDEKMQN